LIPGEQLVTLLSLPLVSSVERKLDTSPDAFGFLRVTDAGGADDGDVLRAKPGRRKRIC
jgi:hypothetical protein